MNIRQLALQIIHDVDVKQAYANIALANMINRNNFSDQDRRFLTELVYGTVKAWGTIDWIMSRYVDRPPAKIPPMIRNILRLGLYQLFFLSKVPPSAACNQAVELAKKYGHPGTVKFVNAVLRSAARNQEKAKYPTKEEDLLRYLALTYFHPEWLVSRWLKRFDSEAVERLLQENNKPPRLSLRTNTLKITREALLVRLAQEGVTCTASDWTPEGIICHELPALASLTSLKEGLFQVQDESSMLVAHVVDPQPGEFVIDACGAPGGKSTHLAALMKNTGRLLSVDLFEHKLAITRENARRLGITCLETLQTDAATLSDQFSGKADRVLVDAPCSGLGVLRRKPDSRWRKTESQLQDLPKLQLSILTGAASCLKPGGVLVYSTCTTEPEENEMVIREFLSIRPDFSLQSAGSRLPSPRQGEFVQLWPHLDFVDGFFISRLKKH
ncbi:16S rRNA methyltransferase [Anaerosporomusa subterranea]|uniref:16S rRNA (cytosine(967)-C(5))-methyltransferase n=1 Tax=Anaerosporomusa subterranea TaxID=1794912 RepID=A0A154BTH5_ANASB|nr:16S rRNA (cytosine(967)-C(5))-methyltransferase RsmB [Anaerosporomusa subterranea]KYZ77207.1 16S rRNA methyltransferase [Anaerosporomusa subterranea]